MSVITVPTCPTTCIGVLGSIDFSNCAPETHFGEISRMYLWALTDVPFASQAEFDSAAHWATHVNGSSVTAGSIRQLIGIGELPEPEMTITPLSNDRQIVGFRKFNMVFDVDETNETNYNWMLTSECGGKYKMCYETADGLIYGGYQGIEVSIIVTQPIPKTKQEVVKLIMKPTWFSKFDPLRQISIVA
jgi:hypothetical protein